jgi:hypothetical protein
MLNDEMIVKKPIVLEEFIVQKFTSMNQLDKVKYIRTSRFPMVDCKNLTFYMPFLGMIT